MADGVLQSGVRGVTDLMVRPGLVNLDFADIRTAMQEMGKAMMGTGEAQGDKRAVQAAEAAVNNPLLDDVSMKGARGVIINVTGGYDMTLFEIDEACNRIRDEVDSNANIIFGATFDEAMEGNMRVSIVATGIDREGAAARTDTTGSGSGGGGGTYQPAPQVTGFGSAPTAPAQAPRTVPSTPPQRTTYHAPLRPAASATATAGATPVATGDQGEGDGELFEQNVFAGARAQAAPPPARSQAQQPAPQARPQMASSSAGVPQRSAPRPVPLSPQRRVEVTRSAAAPVVPTYQPPPRTAVPPQSQPQPQTARQLVATPPVGRRAPTFLERLAGAVQGRPTNAAGAPPVSAPTATRAGAAAPPLAQGSLEIRTPQPVRAPEAVGEGDGLDIPAFLRRQAN